MRIRALLPDVAHWKAQVKCQAGCPVSTDAGRYVQLIAEGRLEEAFLVARAPNPLASVCGRVCAAPCEDAWFTQLLQMVPNRSCWRETERHGVRLNRRNLRNLRMRTCSICGGEPAQSADDHLRNLVNSVRCEA